MRLFFGVWYISDLPVSCPVYIENVAIFVGGNFRENVGKAFHVGVIFTILLLFPS